MEVASGLKPFARPLVLLPARDLVSDGAIKRALASGASERGREVADGASSIRIELDQLSLVVLHVLDEGADGVVGAKDLLVDVLFGEV